MKRFFRVFAWFIGVLVVLVILGQAFLMMRQSSSGKQQVYRNTESVVRVNVDKLLLEMAKNAVLNPQAYLAKDSLREEDRIDLWRAGVAIPANVYFFTTSADSAAYYTLLKLNDKEKFHRYIVQYVDREVETTENGLWYIGAEGDRFYFVGNEQYVLVGLTYQKQDLRAAMHSMLLSNDLVAVSSLDMPQVSASKSTVTYWSRSAEQTWQFDFSNGAIAVSGDWAHNDWILSDKPEARAMDTDNLLCVWLHADIRPTLMRHRDFFESYHVDIDSIQPFIGNYLEVQWKPHTILQQDTVITYDYDDNFDMVEMEEIRDTPVPDIRFVIKASPHLLPSLPDKMFYRFGKQAAHGLIHLSTDEEAVSDGGLEAVDDHFYLQYSPTAESNMLIERFPWLGIVSSAELKGQGQDSHRMSVTGLVTFEKEHIHPVKQLIDR